MSDLDPRLDDPDWLEEQYWSEGRSLRDIADETGAADQTVRRRLLEYGLGTRGQSRTDPRLDDPEWLREQYVDDGRTLEDIARETGVSVRIVSDRLLEYGIRTRRSGPPA